MKRVLAGAILTVVTLVLADSAFALPPGRTIVFDGKGQGKVIFDGPTHKAKGYTCKDCHTPPTKFFEMRNGADVLTMKDMEEGKFCGGCHNGAKAFSVKDQAACGKCHKK